MALVPYVALGCSSTESNPVDGTPGASGAGSTGGSSSGAGAGMGTAGSGDPYAIPANPPAAVLTPTPRLARLSRQQWANAVRDLLKLTDIADVENGVSGDALIHFDTEADALFVTEQLRQQLAVAAEKLANKVVGNDAALAALLPASTSTDTAEKGKAFIVSFGRRAFRRPLKEAEVTSHLGLFNQGPTLDPGVDAFKAGVKLVIEAMLQSPYFLYRTELATVAGGAKIPLDNHEVAAKLALALTNTIPDEALFAAADAGKLSTPADIAEQAKRLLSSARGTNGLGNFNFQVYRLGTYDGIQRDTTMFPDWKAGAPTAMRREVLQFIDWIFSSGKGVKDFYTTPVGFVNAATAPLYGVTGNYTGDDLVKVDLDPTQRAGILTQPGFLASYAKGADPDIIHRGVFIATRLLCIDLPPPDPNATSLIDLQPNMTNRERVEMTTGKGTCGQACHAALLNPLGYAFENYDAIGKFRTMDHGKPVDAADIYQLDGEVRSFTNGVELSHALSEAKQLHHCYVENMMTYLHGRPLQLEEDPLTDYYARLSRAGKISLHDLELAIVTSEAFLNRLP